MGDCYDREMQICGVPIMFIDLLQSVNDQHFLLICHVLILSQFWSFIWICIFWHARVTSLFLCFHSFGHFYRPFLRYGSILAIQVSPVNNCRHSQNWKVLLLNALSTFVFFDGFTARKLKLGFFSAFLFFPLPAWYRLDFFLRLFTIDLQ